MKAEMSTCTLRAIRSQYFPFNVKNNDIDLFASRLKNQCTQYVSYRPDHGALAIDTFSLSWTEL